MATKTKTVEQKVTDYKKTMTRKMEAISQIADILSNFKGAEQEAICETVIQFFELEIDVDC